MTDVNARLNPPKPAPPTATLPELKWEVEGFGELFYARCLGRSYNERTWHIWIVCLGQDFAEIADATGFPTSQLGNLLHAEVDPDDYDLDDDALADALTKMFDDAPGHFPLFMWHPGEQEIHERW